jgi:hypothetical protein
LIVQLNVALLDGLPDVVAAVSTSALVAANVLAATANRVWRLDHPFAVKADPRVLLDGRKLIFQGGVLLHELNHVRTLNLIAFAGNLQ